MDKSLSGDEVLRLVNNKANIIIYPELENYNHIDEVLEPYGCAIILYLSDVNYGHWVGLIKHKDRIEFYDSYAVKPDSEFDYIKEKSKRKLNYKKTPYLSKLLYESGYKIEYNHNPMQCDMDGINTCGRHVGLRLLLKDIPLPEYIQLISSVPGMTADEVVYELTRRKIKE